MSFFKPSLIEHEQLRTQIALRAGRRPQIEHTAIAAALPFLLLSCACRLAGIATLSGGGQSGIDDAPVWSMWALQFSLWFITAICVLVVDISRFWQRSLLAAHIAFGIALSLAIEAGASSTIWQWASFVIVAALAPIAVVTTMRRRAFAVAAVLLQAVLVDVLVLMATQPSPVQDLWQTVAAGLVLIQACLVSSGRIGHPASTAAVAIERERQRIAADLHDGVGSKLVGLIAQQTHDNASQAGFSQALQECLLDLQLTVDGMRDESGELVERLARLRYRIQPALDRRGITLVWRVAEPAVPQQVPQNVVDAVLKMVQEALANVLKHSEASRVVVCLAKSRSGQLRLEIRDNGRGCPPIATSAGFGSGLAGMAKRSQRVGIKFEVKPARGGGTSVRWRLPSVSSGRR